MTSHPEPIVASAERLCETLERIAGALVALDAETLLETEETLGRVLAALAAKPDVHDKAALAALVRRGREALLRCSRLGASFSAVARVRLQLHTGTETYGRDGACAGRAVSGSAVKVRA
jgi:hypothetical protein